MSDQILAIDTGSQSMRALIFDLQGNLLAKVSVPFPRYRVKHPGWAEQDPDIFWTALCQTCNALWQEHGMDPSRLAGVTLTTQRGTVVNVDNTGKPLRPAILWQDQRMTTDLPVIDGWWGLAFKALGVQATMDYLMANAESNWLRIHEPDVWQQTHKMLLLSGFLTHKLTGRYADSVGAQVGYFPFDYKRLKWARTWDWKWKATHIPPEFLVDLVDPTEIIATICDSAAEATGIPKGLPLIAAASDKACEVLGSGCVSPDMGSLSFGTAASVNITSKRYMEVIRMVPPFPSGIPGHYSLEVSLFRGFWMVEWFKRCFGSTERKMAATADTRPEVFLDRMAATVPAGCGGLVLQPYWAPGLKEPGPEARGTLVGFADTHDRAYMYRAVLEGLAFALREGKERIEKRSGVSISQLRVSGGGSQSDVAMQITADIFNLPTARMHTFETSGLGAAMSAAVGLKLHADFPTAVREMTRTGQVFEPNPHHRRLYDGLYNDVYLQIYKRMRPIYKNLQRILP